MVLPGLNPMAMSISWVEMESGTTVHSHELLEATGYVVSQYSDSTGPGKYLCTCQTVLTNRYVLNNVAERMREHMNADMHS